MKKSSGRGSRGGETRESAPCRGRGSGRGGGRGCGRGGGGAGRVFRSGDLRLVVLALIAERPRHGYDLLKAIEEQFAGTYAPSPGSIYPTLTLLEDLGQIRDVATGEDRRLFQLTEAGRRFLDENRESVRGALMRTELTARSLARRSAPDSVQQAFETVRTAILMHASAWTAAETSRVTRALTRVAEEIASGDR